MFFNIILPFLCFLSSALSEFPLIPDPYVIQARDDIDYRLPKNTIPISYDITLEPFFYPDFTFNGEVTIVIQVDETSNYIRLHGNQISFELANIEVKEQGSELTIEVTDLDFTGSDLDFITISLGKDIEVGTILELSIKYTGVLDSTNRGFYRASYEEGSETKWFGTTQFEATSARQAFPCYDEPALKARFTIHIIRKEPYNSISNMPLVNTEIVDDERFKDNFEESVVMSTYLVAFIVSEMIAEPGLNQAVYAAPVFIEDGRGVYPLDTSIKTLEVMEQYTNIPYSISKLYQAAIPNNWFASGAMENWGLVTYREQYLLYKEGISTSAEKQTIAYIISHELAHQWFGNIVSPFWWNYIWLNEGFATYFEYYATNEVEPEMRMMDQIVVRALQNAMASDSVMSSRAMTTDAQSPEAIRALFDRIAYDKSGAVIRMMEHFLTEEIFKRGLEIYLRNKDMGAAIANDLWDGLQAAVEDIEPTILGEATVHDIMITWELQAGYPVVDVVKSSDGELIFAQSRFLLNEVTHDLGTIWTIPINYATSSNPDFTNTKPDYWLKEASQSTDIKLNDDEWIILNKQETGYYRVNYDVDNWNLIIDCLQSDNFETIHLLNRAQLIDDSLNLARSGRLGYDITMRLLEYLSNEVDYIPLFSFFRGLPFLHKHFLYTEYYEEFKSFIKDILQTAYNNLGVEDNGSHTDRLNRINVLTWLCRFEHEDCVNEMHDKLTSYTSVSPDLQAPVYCGGLISDTDTDLKWNYLYSRYLEVGTEYLEKTRILSGLGCTTSIDHITRLLDIVTDQDDAFTVSTSDKPSTLSGIYSTSKIGLETTFDYLLNNFDYFISSGLSDLQISSIFSGISDRLVTEEHKTKFQDFVNSLPVEKQTHYASTFETALNNIETNVKWAEENVQNIIDWLLVYHTIPDDDLTTTEEPDDDDDLTTTAEPDDDDLTTTEEPDDDDDLTTTAEPDDDDLTTTEEPDEDNLTTTEGPDSSTAFTISIPLLLLALYMQFLT